MPWFDQGSLVRMSNILTRKRLPIKRPKKGKLFISPKWAFPRKEFKMKTTKNNEALIGLVSFVGAIMVIAVLMATMPSVAPGDAPGGFSHKGTPALKKRVKAKKKTSRQHLFEINRAMWILSPRCHNYMEQGGKTPESNDCGRSDGGSPII